MLEVKLPDFLIIGAQRCATGWIVECLHEHPEVFIPRSETRFFDCNFDKGPEWWLETYFRGASGARRVGEKTANYLFSEEAVDRIASLLPAASLICCLRNPIDRMISNISLYHDLSEMTAAGVERMVAERPEYVERGKYTAQLQRYYDRFPRENIHVVLYEDKQRDPGRFLSSIYDFLGVDPSFVPSCLNVQTKPGLRERQNGLLAPLSRVLFSPRLGLRRLYSRFRPSKPRQMLAPEARARLWTYFEEDTRRLERLLGRDLGCWREHGCGENA